MCLTAHYALPPPPFLRVIQPPYQFAYPYTLVGHPTQTLLYVCPFLLAGGPGPIPPLHHLVPTDTGSDTLHCGNQEPSRIHGAAAFKLVGQSEEHPFGVPQNIQPGFDAQYFSSEDMALLDLLPDYPVPTPNDLACAYNFNLPLSSNALGIVVDQSLPGNAPISNAYELASGGFLNGGANTAFGNHDIEPHTQLFLAQIHGPEPEPRVTATNTSVGSLPRVTQCPPAPPLQAGAVLPEIPCGPLASRAETPLRTQVLVRQQTPITTPSRPFFRSILAPLPAPPWQQLESPFRPTTRPGTPCEPVHNPWTPSHLPAQLGVPFSDSTPSASAPFTPPQPSGELGAPMGMQHTDDLDLPCHSNNSGILEEPDLGYSNSDAHTAEVPAVVDSPSIGGSTVPPIIRESSIPPHVKRRRLMPAVDASDVPPTDEEIDINIGVESSNIQAKRKSKPPKAGANRPKKGLAMGIYTHEQQSFMALGRASIGWDQLTCSPWSEDPKSLEERAIARAKEATGMDGSFVDQDFIDTMMRADSQIRTQCDKEATKFAANIIRGTQYTTEEHILEDRFLCDGDPTHPENFFKSTAAMDMTVELFFPKGMNLGGIYIHEMLREEDPEVRRRLFCLTTRASLRKENAFNYVDMSSDALRGPPVAAMAFAGITLLHALKKLNGEDKKFDEGTYAGIWARYARALITHPQLGLIRATIFEKMKHKYCEVYRAHRILNSTGPRAWEWRDYLHF